MVAGIGCAKKNTQESATYKYKWRRRRGKERSEEDSRKNIFKTKGRQNGSLTCYLCVKSIPILVGMLPIVQKKKNELVALHCLSSKRVRRQ